jgi:para-nitrobenzyl esterase
MMRCLAILALAACSNEPSALDVELDTGVVRGTDDGRGVRSWLGIPYAAPVVGDLRWRPPRPPLAWDGARDATKVGHKCPQPTVLTPGGGAEDCLTLNVWTPAPAPSSAPVMVWIHGGAFVFGSGGDSFYAGSELARTRGVVVVTINYRLGGLGFFAHPALAAEDPDHPTSGNYGLLDQIAALEWVQRNIAGFGGDAGNVTLFGESAGGFSTCAHYASRETSDLFHRAIVQSGTCSSSTGLERTRAESEAAAIALAEKLGCAGTGADVIACMRGQADFTIVDETALPPIEEQKPGGWFYIDAPSNVLPHVDGIVLPAPIEQRLAAGNYPPRPMIAGSNRDEGTLFHTTLLSKVVMTESQYRATLGRKFGNDMIDAIVAHYSPSTFASPNAALAEVTGDAFFVCPARRNVRAIARAGARVHRYTFELPLEQALIADLGAFHSAEIPFVFGLDTFPLGKVGSSAGLSEVIQGYWTRFAATGNPDGDGVPWPAHDASDQLIAFDVPVAARAGYKTAACDFWDAL